jgi:hypothetical protein
VPSGSPTPQRYASSSCDSDSFGTRGVSSQATPRFYLSVSVSAGCRGTNSLQLDEPLITPRTKRHPPSESGGNMYLHLSQRTAGVGAGPYSASRLERPQIFVIRPPSRRIVFRRAVSCRVRNSSTATRSSECCPARRSRVRRCHWRSSRTADSRRRGFTSSARLDSIAKPWSRRESPGRGAPIWQRVPDFRLARCTTRTTSSSWARA